MGKALIIAEKPYVASDIAKALGGFKKHDDYFESDRYVLSSAVGHLLTITVPEQLEVKRGKWTFAHLPVIPPHFDLTPIEKNEARLKVLTKLIKRKDVDALINACDAGREGELIFRYIVQHSKAYKPIKRLWLQSMTPAAIREGFEALRSDESMMPLADAAVCRSESDWLAGINGTRAMTAFNSKSGGFHLTTVGRVQTPTLAILVEREEKIKKFVPKDYWEIHGTFGAKAGEYAGRWFDEKFVRDKGEKKDGETDHLRSERVWELTQAEAIRDKCIGKPGIVTEESKPTTQLSPLLYDLTSLQREGNARFGFSAKNTLGLAQALYEKHKVLTYPRTDSRALPEDYISTVKKTLGMLADTTGYSSFADQILKQDWVKPNKRIFNNAKVSDHFAIIPTALAPIHLSEKGLGTPATRASIIEGLLYEKYVVRNARELQPTAKAFSLITLLRGLDISELSSPELTGDWEFKLRQMARGQLKRVDFMKEIAAMTREFVGKAKRYESDTVPGDYGTVNVPCPKCGGEIKENYKKFQCQKCDFALWKIVAGRQLEIEEVEELIKNRVVGPLQGFRSKLGRPFAAVIKLTPELKPEFDFGQDQTNPDGTAVEVDFSGQEPLGKCPKCGNRVFENAMSYVCEKAVGANRTCDFRTGKIILQREIDRAQIVKLLTTGKTYLLPKFISKKGRPFSAFLVTGEGGKVGFEFAPREPKGKGKAKPTAPAAPVATATPGPAKKE